MKADSKTPPLKIKVINQILNYVKTNFMIAHPRNVAVLGPTFEEMKPPITMAKGKEPWKVGIHIRSSMDTLGSVLFLMYEARYGNMFPIL